MGEITPERFDAAARGLGFDCRWEDDGDGKRGAGETKGTQCPTEDPASAPYWKIIQLAEQLLFFPATKVDAKAFYAPVVGKQWPVDAARVVQPERIARDLIEFIPILSRSCEELPFASHAKLRLEMEGKELGIRVTMDDLPDQVAQMKDQRTDFFCGGGKIFPNAGNLIALIPGDVRLPSWNLNFHLDTRQTKFVPPVREGDSIRPGAESPLGADDKAGLAIVLEIIRILRANPIPHGEIRMVGLVGEEETAGGAQLIDASALQGNILVSIDGTTPNKIGRAAPEMYRGVLTVETETSHPALIDLSQAVDACAVGRRIFQETGFNPDGHPAGHPSVVLLSSFQSCGFKRKEGGVEATEWGMVKATPQPNSVPSFFTANWQMRNLEGSEHAAQLARQVRKTALRVCAQAAQGRTPVRCEITGTDKPGLGGYLIASEDPGLQLLEAGFNTVGDKPQVVAKQFGGFNGNSIHTRTGKRTLLLGTGANAKIHTNEEAASVSAMARVARGLLGAMLESYQYRKVE